MRETFLFVHPTLGVLGILGALWVFVEALNVDETRLRRMRIVSLIVPGLFLLTWVSGGLWDSFFYEADRTVMESGPWAVVGDTAMELKEHLFVIVLLLALYLPILTFGFNPQRATPRAPTMTASALIVLLGLVMEGAGATLASSVHVGMAIIIGS